jgi:hypothetical protein
MVCLVDLVGLVQLNSRDKPSNQFEKGAGIEVSKKLFGRWRGFMDFGYTLIGDPENLNLRNQWYDDLGVGYDLTKNLLLSMSYEEYLALIAGLSNPRDLLVAINYRATDALRLNASTLIGLSDVEAPPLQDMGVGHVLQRSV